jgi:HPt (histidine-containing phosphotransfer) domain-containing protein
MSRSPLRLRPDSLGMADVTGPARESLGMASPPIAGEAAVIDAAHLARMTLGDRKLEREVLELFDRQAEMLLARMRAAEPAGVASLAHALVGSARGIGAWRVAAAAEALEAAIAATGQPALRELTAAVGEARRAIGGLLRASQA